MGQEEARRSAPHAHVAVKVLWGLLLLMPVAPLVFVFLCLRR